MTQTGRRIAALTASLLLTASTAGLLFTTALAAELPGDTESPAVELSNDPTEESSAPDTADSGSETDPEIPPTQGEEDPSGTTTSQDEQTGTDDPDDPDITAPGSAETEPTSPDTTEEDDGTGEDTDLTGDQTPETTEEEIPTEPTTVAPSRDPEIATGEAVSEGPIPLSTEKGERPADTGGSRPGQSLGSQSDEDRVTGDTQNSASSPIEDDGEIDLENGGQGIRQISIICSIFALVSGAVLVLLKFVR